MDQQNDCEKCDLPFTKAIVQGFNPYLPQYVCQGCGAIRLIVTVTPYDDSSAEHRKILDKVQKTFRYQCRALW